MSALDPLVGDWNVEAVLRFGTVTGRQSFAWELGGAFLLQRSEAEHPVPDVLCVIAPDEDGVGFTQHYFDSRGVVRLYRMTFGEGLWTLERDDVQRFIGRLEDGGDTIRGAWEWKREGAWEKDFDLVYRRSVAP